MAGPALKLKILDIGLVNRRSRSGRVRFDIAASVASGAAVAALGTVPVAVAVPGNVALLDALEAGELLAFA
jgi:hypothetical protein